MPFPDASLLTYDVNSPTAPQGIDQATWESWTPEQRYNNLVAVSNVAGIGRVGPWNGPQYDANGNLVPQTFDLGGGQTIQDPWSTQQRGIDLYNEPDFIGSPLWAATVAMGGAGIGGALTGAFAPSGAAAGGAASTYPLTTGPLATGGAITATPIAAGGAGGIAAGGAASGAGAVGNALGGSVPSWVGNYLIPGLNTLIGANAANNATDAQTAAMQAAIDEQKRQYDTSRADLAPWLNAGKDALGRLTDPNAFTASPDYAFRRDEGLRGIQNTAAARGTLKSGNALKALNEFNQNLAGSEYNNWFNRQAGIAGVGQNTAINLGGLGADTAARTGNYMGGIGDARASGILGRNAALIGGINQGYRNYLYGRP